MARRSRHVLALLPAAALALTALAGCATSTNSGGGTTDGGIKLVKEGKLVTCTHLSYKPFQYTDGDKTVGFDVDLVDLVAKELGVTQEIFDTQFETITSGASFNANQCDVAAAGMTIKEERKQSIDFSDPYFDATQALLVKKDSPIKTLADLKGKKIGVQLDTTGEIYANDNKAANGYEVIQFEDLPLMETAVRTGAVDAAINDNGVLFDYAKEFPDTSVSAEFNTNEQYGIGLKKGNTALLTKVNEVLKKAKDSGEYDKIYEKWFGKKPEKK
ncbi:basic amino acid ABC transporter substrate-binding protein [Lentzea sp. NBC_00516]|uniref:basic amino acid ABC transporter substrate-binding protein n=1 Tax=Lentzea sp. NBC_00516 TaxID=2903582 RepID=UPI002E814960|nr:basic amino acid ABC transporter substrate-binding protein [Lentzea sp. NBC_00516]WUD22923.1 basic amino acid ABC transporter substrate-binding protein [Lentzea sp. NBC_00516]